MAAGALFRAGGDAPPPPGLFGAPEEIRTPDPQIRSLVLTILMLPMCSLLSAELMCSPHTIDI